MVADERYGPCGLDDRTMMNKKSGECSKVRPRVVNAMKLFGDIPQDFDIKELKPGPKAGGQSNTKPAKQRWNVREALPTVRSHRPRTTIPIPAQLLSSFTPGSDNSGKNGRQDHDMDISSLKPPSREPQDSSSTSSEWSDLTGSNRASRCKRGVDKPPAMVGRRKSDPTEVRDLSAFIPGSHGSDLSSDDADRPKRISRSQSAPKEVRGLRASLLMPPWQKAERMHKIPVPPSELPSVVNISSSDSGSII